MEQIMGRKSDKSNKKVDIKVDITVYIFFPFFIFMMRGLENEMYITFVLMLSWIYVAFITDINSFYNALKDKAILFLSFYLLYTFIFSLFFEGIVTSLGYVIGSLYLFIGIFIFNYYKNKYSDSGIMKLLILIAVIWLYYCIKALIFYSQNPNAARYIVSGIDSYGDIAVGGAYGLAYGSAILTVYLFSLLLLNKFEKKNIKIIITIITIIIVLVCIETGSTITLFSMVIGLLFSMSFGIGGTNNKLNKKLLIRKTFWFIFVISTATLFLMNLKKIGGWLVNISSNFSNLIGSRIELIGTKLLDGTSEGTLGVREMLYGRSISTFIESPLFGTSYSQGLQIQHSFIGGHSELFDNLGRLGILGALPYFLIFYYVLRSERKKNKDYINGAYIVTLIIMMVFNPFNYPQSNFILFFIIPLIGMALHKKKEILSHTSKLNKV